MFYIMDFLLRRTYDILLCNQFDYKIKSFTRENLKFLHNILIRKHSYPVWNFVFIDIIGVILVWIINKQYCLEVGIGS